MSDLWYYADQKEPKGPINLEQLRGVLARLPNAADVLVWHASLKGWKKAKEVPELAARGAKPPPLPPDHADVTRRPTRRFPLIFAALAAVATGCTMAVAIYQPGRYPGAEIVGVGLAILLWASLAAAIAAWLSRWSGAHKLASPILWGSIFAVGLTLLSLSAP